MVTRIGARENTACRHYFFPGSGDTDRIAFFLLFSSYFTSVFVCACARVSVFFFDTDNGHRHSATAATVVHRLSCVASSPRRFQPSASRRIRIESLRPDANRTAKVRRGPPATKTLRSQLDILPLSRALTIGVTCRPRIFGGVASPEPRPYHHYCYRSTDTIGVLWFRTTTDRRR